MALQARLEAVYAEVVTSKCRKGRLARIMLEGSDGDAIRAIKELNQMDYREQERGGGEQTEFSELLKLIAKRPRLLPFQDEHDKAVAAQEGLPGW